MEYVDLLFADWLILQASHPVFEGDPVVLRCRGKKEEEIREKFYYKNKKIIRSDYNSNITVYPPLDDDSTYHCTASRESFWNPWIETSNPLKIRVQGNGYTPMSNRLGKISACGDRREVLVSGDSMSNLFQAAMGGRQEVTRSTWVPIFGC